MKKTEKLLSQMY